MSRLEKDWFSKAVGNLSNEGVDYLLHLVSSKRYVEADDLVNMSLSKYGDYPREDYVDILKDWAATHTKLPQSGKEKAE